MDNNKRIESLEHDLRPADEREVELVSLDLVYSETFFNEKGEKGERQLPAQYREDIPFGEPFWHPDLKKWMRLRVRRPLKGTGEHGILADGEVTR